VATFYVDNNVAEDVAIFLFRAGHAATHTRTLGLQTAHDGLQLLTATERQSILVTHNAADFRLLHRTWQCWTAAWGLPHQHAGICILPQGPPRVLVEHLLVLVRSGRATQNRIYRFFPQRGWDDFA
jgi:hypothetical protein